MNFLLSSGCCSSQRWKKGEEDRQEEGWEVESGVGRVKETTTHVYGIEMDVKGARLKLDPNVSVMKMCKEQDYVRTLSCAVLRKR